jgi:hypothetical protein
MRNFAKFACAGALCAFASAAAVQASIIPDATLSDLYADAEVVVHGKVVEQTSRWEQADGSNLIFTYSTVAVYAGAKGARQGDTVVVRTVGGTIDGYSQALIGEADLRRGEEVVLFLDETEGWPRPGVAGFHQGKLRVVRDDVTGDVTLVRDEGALPGAERPRTLDRFTVEEFERRLRAPGARSERIDRADGGVAFSLAPLAKPSTEVGPGALAHSISRDGCASDINRDGVVDGVDLGMLMAEWETDRAGADITGDAGVDSSDLAALLAAWGPCN